MSRRRRTVRAAAVGLLLSAAVVRTGGPAAAAAMAPLLPSNAPAPLAAVTRGMTGTVTIIDTGADMNADPREARARSLAPRADLALDAPLVARIARATPRRPEDGPGVQYVVEFMGTVAGEFDLRTVLQRPDGSFPADLPPLPVRIERNLDDDAGTDVFAVTRPGAAITGRYRLALIVLFTAWALVPAVVVGTRLVRRARIVPPSPPAPPPSLAERLEPLVVAAAERSMTVEERGRLELLLLAHLGERETPAAASRAEAIAALRCAPDTGPLLVAVESWLHQPGPSEPRRRAVAGLLQPFRRATAEAPPAAGGPSLAQRETAGP